MANLVYCLPTDNLLAGVTPTVNTGTALTAYPASFAVDGVPSVPVKFTGTSGSLVFDLGTAKQVDLVAVIGHNLDGTVTIQGHTANSWGAPSVSVVLPTTALEGDGTRPNRWVDLSVSLSAGARTLRYWRLLVSGNTANLSIGEVWLATRRQLATNISWGYRETEDAPDLVHETDAGVRYAFSQGVRIRRLEAELEASDAVVDAMRVLWRTARGRARSFLVIPEGDTGEVLQVRFVGTSLPTTRAFLNRAVLPLQFEELSRGVVV